MGQALSDRKGRLMFDNLGFRKRGRLDNYLDCRDYGHGIFGIWWDEGNGTPAQRLMLGMKPAEFLTDFSADKEAKRLAEKNPHLRYKIAPINPLGD